MSIALHPVSLVGKGLLMDWIVARASATPALLPHTSSARYTQPPPFQLAMNTPAGVSPAATAQPDTAYTVRTGDVLSRIVKRHLEQAGERPSVRDIYRGVQAVAEANGLRNPDYILPGQRLDLSVLSKGAARPAPSAPQAKATPDAPAAPPPPETPEISRLLLETGGPVRAPETRATARSGAPEPLRPHVPEGTVRPGAVAKAHWPSVASAQPAPTHAHGASPTAPRPDSPWHRTISEGARLTSGFGMRDDPFTGERAFHEGIDLAAKRGTPVRAFRPGVVTFSGWQSGYGRVVIVRHDDGLESVYGHNDKNLVARGTRVTAGEPLAHVGSSGRSTGPHLHFEIRQRGEAVDPLPYLVPDRIRTARNDG